VPFVSKATGVQLAKVAARCMVGQTLGTQGVGAEVTPPYFSVKEAVFPFVKFPGVDTILGPEMKSTGEVMGVGKTFGEAFVKARSAPAAPAAAGRRHAGRQGVPDGQEPRQAAGRADRARPGGHGLALVATRGTAAAIQAAGIACETVNKVTEGRPHIVDMIKNGDISLVINTVEERRNAIADSRAIRTSALAGARDHLHHHLRRRGRGGGHEEHGPAGRHFRAGDARAVGINQTSGRPRARHNAAKHPHHRRGVVLGGLLLERISPIDTTWPPFPSPSAAPSCSRPSCSA
jgi:hypothetical protein